MLAIQAEQEKLLRQMSPQSNDKDMQNHNKIPS